MLALWNGSWRHSGGLPLSESDGGEGGVVMVGHGKKELAGKARLAFGPTISLCRFGPAENLWLDSSQWLTTDSVAFTVGAGGTPHSGCLLRH